MSNLEALSTRFLQEATVTNIEKGYVVAEAFNIVVDTEILQLVVDAWAEQYEEGSKVIDAVVGLPQAATPFASVLATKLKIPHVLPARKYALPGAWEDVVTWYADSFTNRVDRVPSYIGGVKSGMRILVLDDVGAHGTTGVAALEALKNSGAIVVGMGLIFDKMWQQGVERIERETGVPVYSLIRIKEISEKGKIILDETYA